MVTWQHGGAEDFVWFQTDDTRFMAAVWQADERRWVAYIVGGPRTYHVTEQAAREWCENQAQNRGN